MHISWGRIISQWKLYGNKDITRLNDVCGEKELLKQVWSVRDCELDGLHQVHTHYVDKLDFLMLWRLLNEHSKTRHVLSLSGIFVRGKITSQSLYSCGKNYIAILWKACRFGLLN